MNVCVETVQIIIKNKADAEANSKKVDKVWPEKRAVSPSRNAYVDAAAAVVVSAGQVDTYSVTQTHTRSCVLCPS